MQLLESPTRHMALDRAEGANKCSNLSSSQKEFKSMSLQENPQFQLWSEAFRCSFLTHPTSIVQIAVFSPTFFKGTHTERSKGRFAQSRASPSHATSVRTHRRAPNPIPTPTAVQHRQSLHVCCQRELSPQTPASQRLSPPKTYLLSARSDVAGAESGITGKAGKCSAA